MGHSESRRGSLWILHQQGGAIWWTRPPDPVRRERSRWISSEVAQFALPIGWEELASVDLAKGQPLFWCSCGIHFSPLELTLLDRAPIARFRTGRLVSDIENFFACYLVTTQLLEMAER